MNKRACSAGSARKRYRYRKGANQVEEGLFGSSAQKEQGEIIQIITKDLIRTLRIPPKVPIGHSIVLPSAEFEQTTSNPLILTKDEREALQKVHQMRKEELMDAAEECKRQLCDAEQSRKENPVLTELELEAKDRSLHLLERAHNLKMEQEDEIIKLNKLILGAQCQATRDDQIQQKKQIKSDRQKEEKRLDEMMEVERRKVMETVRQIEELRKQQRINGREQIYNQIKERQDEKDKQDAMRVQESQHVREALQRMVQEDLMALQKKHEEQQRLQEEVMRINAQSIRAKEERREKEKLAELRDAEYIKKKQERELGYEAEQMRIMKEKEVEISRLRARQQRAKDYKADQDELRAWRNREMVDKEWRKKEKALAAKRVEQEELLRVARLQQVQYKEQMQEIEAERKIAEFERILKAKEESLIKQNEEEEKLRQKALRHSEAIRKQVRERELAANTQRREYLKEADRMIDATRQRRKKIDEYKDKKLRELRATGLCEKYCSEVERKAAACQI